MLISVILCTYGRGGALAALLECLAAQTYRSVEVLVIDGNGPDSPAAEAIASYTGRLPLRRVESPRGLTRQRNVGMRAARGDLICFLDDDVTVEPDFLERVAGLFARPGLEDVGGATGYDSLNYPYPVTLRWRVRRLLGTIPSLKPGAVDRLGRTVPVSFLRPFSGITPVGFLSGFCMIYRAAAVKGVWFDEALPTYGGEDGDFSIRVGRRWRLVLCGDLRLKHHYDPRGRESEWQRVFETAFGSGRRFAKYARTFGDRSIVAGCLAGDLLVDGLSFLRKPSRNALRAIRARASGFLAGLRSCPDAGDAGCGTPS